MMIENVKEILEEKASLEREYLELIHLSDEMGLPIEIHDKMVMASIAHSLSVIADALADRKTEPQKKCHRDEEYACHLYPNEGACNNCKLWYEDVPQTERSE